MRNLIYQIGAVVGLVLLWQGLAALGLWPPYLFPGPADVATTLGRVGANGELVTALLVTLRRILLGYGAATLMGLGLGLLLARSRTLSAVAGPAVLGLQAMPSICWFPLAILWIGLNEGAILFVTAIGTLFAVAAATEAAIRTIPPAYVRAASTMGAKGWRLYWRVVLPAALPTLLTGLRVGWSFAWRSLMAAEMLFMNLGLGHLLGMGRELADAAQVVAVILVILGLGLLVDRLVFAQAEQAVRRRWGFEQAA
jgi:NitT/TauT family transport system permease protein